MPTQCIHGFPSQHCVSCRTCAHGQMTSTCTRCRTALTARATRRTAVAAPQASEAHGDFEIFYEEAVSGWRYRAHQSAPSQLSYRSAFLARKAVDALAAGSAGAAVATAAQPAKPGTTSRRGSKRGS